MKIEANEAETISNALYDAELYARKMAQENAGYGTDAGRLRAKEWKETASRYRALQDALLRRQDALLRREARGR